MNVAFTFSKMKREREAIRSKADLLLGVIANFSITANDDLLYIEQQFPIVELRAQLDAWMSNGFHSFQDFAFYSMESDEEGLVWFRYQSSDQWRVGSVHQEYIEVDTLSSADVGTTVEKYMIDVDSVIASELGIDVMKFLQG
jgi:hypothetical protein